MSDTLPDVFRRDLAMAIDADNDFAFSFSQRCIESGRYNSLGIVHDSQIGLPLPQAVEQLSSALLPPAVSDQNFDPIRRIILRQNRANAPLDASLFVTHRHDDGNKGKFTRPARAIVFPRP